MEDKKVAKKEDGEVAVASMYQNSVNIGTEEVGQQDLNTPTLKVIQNNTQGILGKTDGWYYRSDTKEQIDEVSVNLVYVTTQEMEDYEKKGTEQVKIYFGFYAGTNEPFKMFCRGWALGAHRAFQTQVARIKGKFQVPMLALTVNLTSEEQQGTIPDSNKPYLVYKPVFTILKTDDGKMPQVEMNPERISFLVESAKRFREVSSGVGSKLSENDIEQNESDNFDPSSAPDAPQGTGSVNPEDVPF